MSKQSHVVKVGYDSFYFIEHNFEHNFKLLVPGVHTLDDKMHVQPDRPEVKGPWRGILQAIGLRKEKIIFGQSNRGVFRKIANSTLREYREMTHGFYSASGFKKLFLKNNVNDNLGIDDSLLDYKMMDLFDMDADNCTFEQTLDFTLYPDRKERIQSLMDDAGDFKVIRNPLGQLSYNHPVEINLDRDWMPSQGPDEKVESGVRSKAFCVNFAPADCMTADQLKKRYSQHGYVKFEGDKQIIRRRGTRDFIIVSAPVWLDAQDDHARMKIKPGRPYELKTDSRVVSASGTCHIIHVWKQV